MPILLKNLLIKTDTTVSFISFCVQEKTQNRINNRDCIVCKIFTPMYNIVRCEYQIYGAKESSMPKMFNFRIAVIIIMIKILHFIALTRI